MLIAILSFAVGVGVGYMVRKLGAKNLEADLLYIIAALKKEIHKLRDQLGKK